MRQETTLHYHIELSHTPPFPSPPATVFCDDEAASDEGEDDSGQLTLLNMGGVFLLHGILTSASLILAIIVWFRMRRDKAAGMTARGVNRTAEKVADESMEQAPSFEEGVVELPMHGSTLLSGSVGRDFAVESLRSELNDKLDKLLLLLDKKGN
jgi:hypothetical protein